MDRCRQWVTKRGKRGRDVFRFEWRKHKRVLQFRSKPRFQPCKLPHHRFYRKLYRLDAPSDDWGVLRTGATSRGSSGGGPPGGGGGDDRAQLEYEYLEAVLQAEKAYSCKIDVADPATREGTQEEIFFQVIGSHTAQSKPKRVETHKTRIDMGLPVESSGEAAGGRGLAGGAGRGLEGSLGDRGTPGLLRLHGPWGRRSAPPSPPGERPPGAARLWRSHR